MVSAGRGVVAGVASLAAWRGLPGAGAYCASKAALVSLLESARVDLRGTGVDVVIVCPGFIHTEMTSRYDPSDLPLAVDSRTAARIIIAGIEARRRFVQFPASLGFLARWVARAMPGFLYDRLVAAGARGREARAAARSRTQSA